jgi:hypothetical protein
MLVVGERASERRADAPDVEKARRHDGPPHPFRQIARSIDHVVGEVPGDGLERRVEAVPVLEAHGRDIRPSRPIVNLRQLHEPIAVGKRQRPEQDGADGGEHRTVGADAKSEHHHHRERKGGRASQRPDRMAEVAEAGVHPGRDVHVASLLAQDDRIAEPCSGASCRFVGSHAFGADLVGALGDVECQLALDVALDPRRAKRV